MRVRLSLSIYLCIVLFMLSSILLDQRRHANHFTHATDIYIIIDDI